MEDQSNAAPAVAAENGGNTAQEVSSTSKWPALLPRPLADENCV